jgi:hypothetical protein
MTMAWKSTTFHKPERPAKESDSKEISRAAERHRGAMKEVIQQARDLAEESRRALEGIKDPALRRSAER